MNIFYLHANPKICAQQHVDKHCVKMILEYAQLLSTAHRFLDGTESIVMSVSGRKKKTWTLPDFRDSVLYSATHINHPSAIWSRRGRENYMHLYNMFIELCAEYTHRYHKIHKCESMKDTLALVPNNIGKEFFTQPTPAMPDYCKVPGDSIASYRNYYIQEKSRMAVWKTRPTPDWYIT
jgi:hypothetical protein